MTTKLINFSFFLCLFYASIGSFVIEVIGRIIRVINFLIKIIVYFNIILIYKIIYKTVIKESIAYD